MASIVPGYEYDIFISYRQKDNKHDGWVSEFVNNLKGELESTIKEEISVYFDINPSDGLLETHDVDASLKEKLKCLICIPIISLTYCDPRSFAWEHEFKAFVEQASKDYFGLKVKLPNGNVANRVLPVRIHDLDIADIKLFESTLGGVLRPIDFVYKETGVNRQLRSRDDDVIKNPNQILYRDQINKVALAVKDIIGGMNTILDPIPTKENDKLTKSDEKKEIKIDEPDGKEIIKSKQEGKADNYKPERDRRYHLFKKPRILFPIVLITVAFLSVFIFLLNRHSKTIWAKEKAVPEIEQFKNDANFVAAFNLFQRAEKYILKDAKFKELKSWITTKETILTDPPAADVYFKEYSDTAGIWKKLGRTPIDSIRLPSHTYYLMKIEKAGYHDILAVLHTQNDTLTRKLFKTATTPQGMVYVEGLWVEGKGFLKDNCGFFIDRYEVTNKQFKEFVDKGGYRNPQYWKNDFIKNGKNITLEKALPEFTDKTGRLGPATWEAGDYPDGQDNYPVTGVSWYEAAAYAEFAGKSLPTTDHWAGAAEFYKYWFRNIGSNIFPLSNFNGKGPEPVGRNKGVNCFGAFDMAGNVREWCWNETKIGRVIRGGGWDDPVYMYNRESQVPPFDRSPKNGFRCVQYIDKEKIPVDAFRRIDFTEGRDYSKEKPVPENIFNIYKNQFLYDKIPLDAITEKKYESHTDWDIEKISFRAAYGDERMTAYLFLPKNASPPFQTIVYFPGSDALDNSIDLINYSYATWNIHYILKSGRAVMYPVYKGTFERGGGNLAKLNTEQGHLYTEWLIKWVKDLSRSIDYMETRPDIDCSKLGYYGISWGGALGGIIPAVESRLAVSMIVTGGFRVWYRPLPEADAINYVSRIKIPVLILSGKYDTFYPPETAVKPFFNLLGTSAKDKRLIFYETDHFMHPGDIIKETLKWIDQYLGPVKYN